MCATWRALRQSLEQSIRTLQAGESFNQARLREPSIHRFTDPEALVAFLHEGSGDLNEKDGVLAALLREVQRVGSKESVASSLLWLGLWPGLSGVRYRCEGRFAEDADVVVPELVAAFTRLIRRPTNARLTKVAAGLVRGTERLLKDKARSESERRVGDDSIQDDDVRYRYEVEQRREWQRRVPTPRMQEILVLAGDDAELVVRGLLLGEDHNELAKAFQIRPATVRKRLERARKNLAAQLSHFNHHDRVLSSETDSVRED